MFDLIDANGAKDCEGISRRDFVRAGVLGLGGLSLPEHLSVFGRPHSRLKGIIRSKRKDDEKTERCSGHEGAPAQVGFDAKW